MRVFVRAVGSGRVLPWDLGAGELGLDMCKSAGVGGVGVMSSSSRSF